jgi:hypothetical protein
MRERSFFHGRWSAHGVGAQAEAAGTLLVFRKAVESLDDIEQPDLAGWNAEHEPAGGALPRTQQPFVHELLQNLREEVRGDLLFGRNVFHYRACTLGNLSQVYESTDSVFRGTGINHEQISNSIVRLFGSGGSRASSLCLQCGLKELNVRQK